MKWIANVSPVPKPRMTRRDKWQKRPCVARYWAFKDMIRMHGMELRDEGAHILFVIEMPKSWTENKCQQYDGVPHQTRPDLGNLLKALEDALRPDDERIWHYSEVGKVWGRRGRIEVWYDGV